MYISGYVYQVGAEKIPLSTEEVIYFKRPNPLDAYRGMSWVQSLLIDIGADREAGQYVRNFFRNGAEPGGVIEFPEELSDAEWEKFVARWREQHQGVSNAHRVGILEGAKWVDRHYSLGREMQFAELRRLNRDQILGGCGVPKSVMGITEDVNRANAEAGEVVFARWCILPRLRRLRAVVNRSLLPRWGDNLYFDFVDPTPDNREYDLLEATQGYAQRILTKNEARVLLDHPAVDDGDEFMEPPKPLVLPPGEDDEADEDEKRARVVVRSTDPLLSTPEERAEAAMRGAWEGRLASEGERVAGSMEQFKAGAGRGKVEAGDIEGYTWDWWERYGDEVMAELVRAFEVGAIAAEPGAPLPQMQQLAATYARYRAGELLRMGGEPNLIDFTQSRLREVIAQALERGDSLGDLQRALRDDFAFSRQRAESIARTETATALGHASIRAGLSQGRDEKHWVTQADAHVDEEGVCRENAAQGWIPIGRAFQSGHDTVPGHPRCRCVCRTRTAPVADIDPLEGLAEENAEAIAQSRGLAGELLCPRCAKRLPINGLEGKAEVYCKRCDAVFAMEA